MASLLQLGVTDSNMTSLVFCWLT